MQDAGWFLAGISTVLATLASVIAVLFKLLESKNVDRIADLKAQVLKVEARLEESDKRHDECQLDRSALTTKVALIEEELRRVAKLQQQ